MICVGNLSVGGTGKTPMIEYLVRLFKNDYRVATLSRGYKRQTTGFLLANEKASAESIGDEPFQFYNKFYNDILVAVDTNRQHGISKLMQLDKKPDVILLDDAYQHRKVKAGFNILLTTYSNPYFSDYVLPTGNLREPKSGAKRANIIVVTKCPNTLSKVDENNIRNNIKSLAHQQVFFSFISYSEVVFSLDSQIKLQDLSNFTLVTGIANSETLVDFLNAKGLNFEHLNFKDHHDFSKHDIAQLKKKPLILTTEKDFVRLKKHKALKATLFYLPIKLTLNNEKKFNEILMHFMMETKQI